MTGGGPPVASVAPGAGLLDPFNHAMVLIDHQSQMAFATKSIDAVMLRNNVGLVARVAAEFEVPTILTTIAERTFSRPLSDEIRASFLDADVIDRMSMNCWEDRRVVDEVNRIGRARVVLAGLWTSVCVVAPALSALEQAFAVYAITDACGDVSSEAHERAVSAWRRRACAP